MKINQQFQERHMLETSNTDWCVIQMIERDICLLYHQLADYSYIMGDLYYGDVYALPYWEYLNLSTLEGERQQFIRNGCLVMLYAMASEVLDTTGTYLTVNPARYLAVKSALDSLPDFDPDTNRLIAAVKTAIKLIDEEQDSWSDTPEMIENNNASTWIHERYVRQYFIVRAEEFESNSYFRDNKPEKA